MSAEIIQRLALIGELARRVKLGRTAIMKLCFFLQESQGIPLGYNFSLYSYGPFDSDVLSDLTAAENYSILKSNVVYYSSGTGYEYILGPEADRVAELASDFIEEHQTAIEWVTTTFGHKSAGQLELLSTLLFVAKYHNPKNVDALVEQVNLIKPHFSHEQIRSGFDSLLSIGVLRRAPTSVNA